MKDDQQQHLALITGASAGIGEALAHECAGRGMNLLLVALPGTGLPGLADEMGQRYKVDVRYFETDLTGENAHREIFGFTQDNHINVSVLINNIGIGYNGNLEHLSEEMISEMIILNMRTTTLMTQTFLPELRKRDKAYILNMCSLAACSPLPGKCVYAATKAYVWYLTRALRKELKSSKINVSAVLPAGVYTNQVVRERIRLSTWFAKTLVLQSSDVARMSIHGMLKGEEIIFPGNRLKAFFLLTSLLPQGLVINLTAREFLRTMR